MEEVARHIVDDSLWMVVDGHVVDVSKFLKQHPGGPQVRSIVPTIMGLHHHLQTDEYLCQ